MVARSGTPPTVIENSPTPATPPVTTSPGASWPTPTGVSINTRSPGKSATERESMATSAVALLALFEPPEVIARFIDKVTGLTGLKPNIDVALVAHHRLPADAAFGLFATARSSGAARTQPGADGRGPGHPPPWALCGRGARGGTRPPGLRTCSCGREQAAKKAPRTEDRPWKAALSLISRCEMWPHQPPTPSAFERAASPTPRLLRGQAARACRCRLCPSTAGPRHNAARPGRRAGSGRKRHRPTGSSRQPARARRAKLPNSEGTSSQNVFMGKAGSMKAGHRSGDGKAPPGVSVTR